MSDFNESVQWDTEQSALGENLYECTCVCRPTPLDSSLFSFFYSAGPGGWSPSPDPAVGHCWTGKLYRSSCQLWSCGTGTVWRLWGKAAFNWEGRKCSSPASAICWYGSHREVNDRLPQL